MFLKRSVQLDILMTYLILIMIVLTQMVDNIYLNEIPLNKANASDTEVPFLDLNSSISNDRLSTNIYDKQGPAVQSIVSLTSSSKY